MTHREAVTTKPPSLVCLVESGCLPSMPAKVSLFEALTTWFDGKFQAKVTERSRN
jgi:hypothetical protein